MQINNMFSFLKKHRVFILIVAFFAGIFLLGLDSAFAAVDDPVISKEDSDKVVKILNGFITGAAALMGMVTAFITMFLYPGWVNGTLFGLQDYLKIMWILISNVVYFVFAFILIAIAFMNIIGKGEGTWELKQAMPKFIIGVLIVPFSWFFVQFLLSLSAILTVGVLTLPYDSFQGNELFDQALENPELAGKEICKDVIISFNGDFEGQPVEQLSSEENELDEHIKCKNGGKITVKELLTGTEADGSISADAAGLQNSIFGVMSIYTYGILKIDELDTISAANLESVKTIADLVFKIVFDVLFIAVYLLLMIALLLALFVRGVRLWVYMMLSPVFGLLYFFGKGSEGFGESGDKFNIKEFIALALVPVYVSAALAFGLVFILVAGEGIKETNDGEDVLKAGGFSLTILGAHGDQEAEKSVIGKLVVEIFGVVILWIAVMAALGSSKTTKAIVEPIAQFGKSVGDLAAKAPTYAPIIPTGNGGMSVTGLQQVGSTLTSQAEQGARSRGSEFMKSMGGDSDGIDLSTRSANVLATHQASGNRMTRDALEELKLAIAAGGSVQDLARSPQFLATVNHLMQNDERFKNDNEIKNMNPIRSGDALALGKALSQMDMIMDRQYTAIGGFMEDTVSGSSAGTAAVVNERLFPATPGVAAAAQNTNNVVLNVTTPTGQAFEHDFDRTGIEINGGAVTQNSDFNNLKNFFTANNVTRDAADTSLKTHFPDDDQREALLDAMGLT